MIYPVSRRAQVGDNTLTCRGRATDFVGQCYEHERVPRPYMQMMRIKEESWIIMIVSTRWNLKFKVFVRDVFLLKIHATEVCGVPSELVRTQGAPKRGEVPTGRPSSADVLRLRSYHRRRYIGQSPFRVVRQNRRPGPTSRARRNLWIKPFDEKKREWT